MLYDWYSELRADTCPFESDVDIVPKCPGNVPYVEWIIINGLKAEGPLLIKEIEAYDTNGVKLTFGTGSVIIDHSNDDEEDEEIGSESRVGAAMTDLTNRRVIILVLINFIKI